MSRLLVLVPIVLWFLWLDATDPGAKQPGAQASGLALFLGGLLLTVVLAAYAALRVARLEAQGTAPRGLPGLLNRMALPLLLGWFAVGLFLLGWGHAAMSLTDFSALPTLRAPGLLLATLPAYGAWALLLAAEYPAVRQRRELRLLDEADEGRPIYAPPSAGRYWTLALRQRLLFALVPLLVLMAVRDVALLGLWALGVPLSARTETWLFVASALVVIAISPELVRRLLPTRPLGRGDLRQRLEGLCGRVRLPMRDILVWDTGGSMVNAAVIGFLPRMRYVLLTDLMLESLTPVQVEAVFAHEVGHVKHRHLLWYFIFLAGMTLFFAGPVDAAWRLVADRLPFEIAGSPVEYAIGLGSLGVVLALFGLLSRCFERQADVFAARTMQAEAERSMPMLSAGLPAAGAAGAVGFAGAEVFSSSLRQAARLNHLPLDMVRAPRGPLAWFAWVTDQLVHFLHGTIRSRIDYLHRLAQRPTRTYSFDLRVLLVKLTVLAVTAGSASFLIWR